MKNKTNSKRLATFFITVIVLAALVLSTYKNIANNLSLGLDLQGGFEILYEVEPLNENDQLDMSAVSQSVSKRVDVLGVSEPQIIIEGDNRIRERRNRHSEAEIHLGAYHPEQSELGEFGQCDAEEESAEKSYKSRDQRFY